MSVPSGTSKTSFKKNFLSRATIVFAPPRIVDDPSTGRKSHAVVRSSIQERATAECRMDRKTREVFAEARWGEEDLELGFGVSSAAREKSVGRCMRRYNKGSRA